MPIELFSNAASDTLDGAINSSVTTLTLNDASSFPVGNFRILIETELLFCTSRATNVLTVIRGIENTTAASHLDTTQVKHLLTAGSMKGLRDNILAEVGMIDDATSLSTDDDNFDDQNFSGWTAVGTTPTPVVTEAKHRASIRIPTGTAAAQLYGWVKAKTPSAGKWIQCGYNTMKMGSPHQLVGPIFASGATYGSNNAVQWGYSSEENIFCMSFLANWNSLSGQNRYESVQLPAAPWIHLRFVWNSADNYDVMSSVDCVSWNTIASATLGTLGTVSHCGFGISAWGSNKEVTTSLTYCRFNF